MNPLTDTSPLSNHPLFDISSVEQARQLLSGLYGDLVMEPVGARPSLKGISNGIQLSRFTLNHTFFSTSINASKTDPMDIHSLQFVRSGLCEYEFENTRVFGNRQRCIMLPAGQIVKANSSADNAILTVIISDTKLREQVSAYLGHNKFPPIRFSPEIDITTPHGTTLFSIVQTFTEEVNRPHGLLESPVAVARFEDLLVSILLFGIDNNLEQILGQPAPMADSTLVKRIEGYLEANASNALEMKHLAKETGHSISSIYRTFKQYRGYTPTAFLQKIRFSNARRRLLTPDPTDTVTCIAMDCGFFHMGRFAGAYKQKFGESPKQTLLKSRQD